MISTEIAVEYFNNHLLGEIFLEASAEERNAVLVMAERDIVSLLNTPGAREEQLFIPAVCEQAVFLLTRKEELTRRQILLSETVEGMGSRSYSACGEERLVLAPRAELYLKHLNAGGSLLLNRG